MVNKVHAEDVVSAVAAWVLAFLGIPLQAVVWGAIGSLIGASFAPKLGMVKVVLTYGAASLLSALAGTALAHTWFEDDKIVTNAASGVFAVLFHPAITAIVKLVPKLIPALLEKVGIRLPAASGADEEKQ